MTDLKQDATGEVSRCLNDPSGESDNESETCRWGYGLQVNLHPDDAYPGEDIGCRTPGSIRKLWNSAVRYLAARARKLTICRTICGTPTSATRPPLRCNRPPGRTGRPTTTLSGIHPGYLRRLRTDEQSQRDYDRGLATEEPDQPLLRVCLI